MARLSELDKLEKRHLESLACPSFDTNPFVKGVSLKNRRVAIFSTAGLHGRGDRPFTLDPGDAYRIIPGDIEANGLVMSHVSTNFDHTGFQQDWNVVFPIDRLRELVQKGEIGSVADYHYSFMGAIDPLEWENDARRLAGILKKDAVDIDHIADFICDFMGGHVSQSPRPELSPGYALNLVIDDLKAYYFEAITAQPSQASPSSRTVSDWFWGETFAANVLYRVAEMLSESEDGMVLTVPVDQKHRT